MAKSAKIITLFNHKGGVSKTTTTFNLGWMMAEKGKRVMLVDADPQCNLTGMVLGFEHRDSIAQLTGEPDNPRNIREGLMPAFEAKPYPVSPVKCEEVSGNENLFLLPGNIRLAEYEVTLGIAQELSAALFTLQNIPGSVRHLISETAARHSVDYVLVDTSPTLGPLNQNLLMTSDFFIIPVHPDYFSAMGIESLAEILPKWRRWAEKAAEVDALKEATYPFHFADPKYLGAVLQRFNLKKGQPAKAFQKWVDAIRDRLDNILIPEMRKADMMLSDKAYKKAGFSPSEPLLQMSDFNSLIAASQEKNKPVFSLLAEDMGQSGMVWETSKKSMKKFRDLFSESADRIIQMAH